MAGIATFRWQTPARYHSLPFQEKFTSLSPSPAAFTSAAHVGPPGFVAPSPDLVQVAAMALRSPLHCSVLASQVDVVDLQLTQCPCVVD